MARDTSKLVTIPGELHSAATGNIVAAAEEVFDYTTNKYQKDINQEVAYIKEDSSVDPIPSFNPQSQTVHLDEQVLSNAQKKQVRKNIGLGNGDIDSTPTSGSDNVVRSGGVYSSMQELRSTVNPQVGYYTCSTAGDTAAKVIDASGYTLLKGGGLRVNFTEKNTAANATLNIEQTGAKPLYYNGVRVSTNNSWYAGEIMTLFYDGAAFQLNSLPDLDEYDVSARNGGQAFTFDEAVALVPEAYRHGGLKLRFISNSDSSISGNKYVEYRLMKNTWSTTVSDWQGVDNEPTAGSNNLVNSGGIADKLSELEGKSIVEIKGIFNQGSVARENLQVGDYFGYCDVSGIVSIGYINTEKNEYTDITAKRYVMVDNMAAYIEDGKLYFIGNGGVYKVDSIANYPSVGGHFSSVNGILYYMPTTASSWVIKYFRVNVQNGTIVERSVGESYYYNDGSFVLIPSDIESIYLEQGAISQDGTDITPINLRRLRSGKIYGTLDLTLPDGYNVYILYYYNISDGSLNERTVLNLKHCLIGKSGCYARIVISKSDDTNLVVTDVKHTTSIEDYHDAINDLNNISVFNKNAEFGVVPTDIYIGKQKDYSFGSKWTTSADLLAKFDALVDSKYITKQSIGKDSENKDMYMYSTNPQPSQIIGVQPKKRYRVLVVCSQHGFEKVAALSMYYVLKELTENALQSNVLRYIADNVQLNVIPIPNQYGWDNLMYTNVNKVNLNRNWGVEGWQKAGTPGSSTYTGEAAFDQAETRNIRDWMLSNKDVTLVVDYHTNGSSRLELGDGAHAIWLSLTGIGAGSQYCDKLLSVADISIRNLRGLISRIYSTDMAGYDKDSYWYCDNAQSSDQGTLKEYGYEQGFLSVTLEGFCGFPGDSAAGYSANTKKANTEEFVNFLTIFSQLYSKA